MSIKPGDTFVIDPDGGSNAHLWVVLAVERPDWAYEDYALIVNVTTLDKTKLVDPACVLNVGDHAFVSHESFAHYGRMREVELGTLSGFAASARQPCSADLLKRLIQGLHQSKYTKRGHKARVPQKG